MAFLDKYKPGQQENTLSSSNNNWFAPPIFGNNKPGSQGGFPGFPQARSRPLMSTRSLGQRFTPPPNLLGGMRELGQNRPNWRKAPLGGRSLSGGMRELGQNRPNRRNPPLGGRSLSGGPLGGGSPSFTPMAPAPTIGGQGGPALGPVRSRPPEGPRGFSVGPITTNWDAQLEMSVRNYWAENPDWDPTSWIAERSDVRGPIIERIQRERGLY